MSDNAYKKMYRQFTQRILTKIVNPTVLGNSTHLEQDEEKIAPQMPICYVIQDDSMSNKVLINHEIEKKQQPSAFSPLIFSEQYQEDDAFLILEKEKSNASQFYPDKLIRLVEYLLKFPEADVLCVPVTILWGRAPDNQDSWYKALMADAWTKPTGIKQALNITLYRSENYIEFHQAISLRSLLQAAHEYAPNFSPAHYVVKNLNQSFNQYKEAILGPDLSDRRNVISKLMLTDAVKAAVLTESIEKNINMNEAEKLARSYLEEIVSDFSYSTLRFAEIMLTKLWTQLYDGIEIHNFEMVRELSKEYELVYTPCHRSHIDYLLLSYVIFKQGLMVPHIAAGINLNMPVVGQLMRGAGAYFIRRSFNGNALYTAVFKEYIHSLILRNTPLEYFIEGGRSRTGFLLPAKKGMLAMTIQSYLRTAESTKPIVFIPTYFGYEKLLEGSSYLDELGGQKKQAESLLGLVKSLKSIEKVFGKVQVNFGQPVYLSEHLQQHQVPKQIKLEENLPDSVKETVSSVANEILENINCAAVLNPISLLSLVLLHASRASLAERDVLFQLEQLKTFVSNCAYDDRLQMTALSPQEIIQYGLQLKQVEFIEHDHERWLQVVADQENLLKYFMHNIQHVFALPAVMAEILKSSVAEQAQGMTRQSLLQHVKLAYPELQAKLFLKWKITELEQEVDKILHYFIQQQLLNLTDDQIHLSMQGHHRKILALYAQLHLA